MTSGSRPDGKLLSPLRLPFRHPGCGRGAQLYPAFGDVGSGGVMARSPGRTGDAPEPTSPAHRPVLYGWYGRGATFGVVPSTQAGLPCEVMVTFELVRPGADASMTEVPE